MEVAFKCAASRSRGDYKKEEMWQVVTLRLLKTGNELLADFGVKYSF